MSKFVRMPTVLAFIILVATGVSLDGKPQQGPEQTTTAGTNPSNQAVAAPLAARIGFLELTPTGFVDFMAVYRSRNIGSGLGTDFGAIPLSNTVFGNRSTLNIGAETTRLGARIEGPMHGVNVRGLVEADFLGFIPGNVFTSTNSYGLRLRQAYAQVRTKKWGFLAGQTWSLITPNRAGTSAFTSDLQVSQDIDPNLQLGLPWARNPQLRVSYHPGESLSIALTAEAPDVYGGGSGGAGTITLPAALAPNYFGQIDMGDGGFGVPGLFPDVLAKIALDHKAGDRNVHFEVLGLLSHFNFFNPQNNRKFGITGGGGSINAGIGLSKNLQIYTNNFYSDGGGRYIFGQGPDLVIRFDGSPSLVHSMSTQDGIQYRVTPKWEFFSSYGGAYFRRNVVAEPSGAQAGFGSAGAPNNQNRSLQEVSVGFTHEIWQSESSGKLQAAMQYSWLIRRPWFVPSGNPASASVSMLFFNLRYVLPSAPPAFR
jgi:hypothetical protein